MNVAIIGCGVMGNIHAAMATNTGFKVTVFADREKKRAKKLAKRYEARATDDAEAAIRRDDVDVVCIATPTMTHKGLLLAAAAAGKPIFCEKPFCRTVEECDEVIEAATRAGIKLFIGQVVRYFHEFEAIRAQIKCGQIGKPGFVRMFRGGACPEGVNGWFRDFKKSGGVLFDCSIHDLDWLRYTFGDAERVFCQNLMRKKPEAMDYALATVRMKSGLIAQVVGSWAHPSGFRVKVEVCGSGGIVQYDSGEAPLVVEQRQHGAAGPGAIVPASPVAVSPYQLEWEDFAAWLRHNRKPRVTPEDGRQAVALGVAALQSAKTGQPVAL